MKRALASSLITIGVLATTPPPALAGGIANRLEFRFRPAAGADGARAAGSERARWDVFAAGETVVAQVNDLSGTLDPSDGPFHLWIERGQQISPARPILQSAIRVATFRMAPSVRGGTATFTVPSLPRGRYTLSVCDDPCRTWGFDEIVQGRITVVPSIGEARLVARIREFRSDAWEARRALQNDLREALRTERSLEAQVSSLTDELAKAQANLTGLSSGASGPAPMPARPMLSGPAAAWLVAATVSIAGLWLFRRRRRAVELHDTAAEQRSRSSRTRSDVRDEAARSSGTSGERAHLAVQQPHRIRTRTRGVP